MSEMTERRLFVGVKVSPNLRNELQNPAPGTDRYLKEDSEDRLQIVEFGEDKVIGCYITDGFPVADIDTVSRNVRRIITLITRGHRFEEDSIRIYVV